MRGATVENGCDQDRTLMHLLVLLVVLHVASHVQGPMPNLSIAAEHADVGSKGSRVELPASCKPRKYSSLEPGHYMSRKRQHLKRRGSLNPGSAHYPGLDVLDVKPWMLIDRLSPSPVSSNDKQLLCSSSYKHTRPRTQQCLRI